MRSVRRSTFDKLLDDAIAAEQQYRKLEAGNRRSARSLIRECVEWAGTARADVEALRDRLNEYPGCRAFVNRASNSLRDYRYSSPPQSSRLGAFGDECVVELDRAGATREMLFTVAVMIASEKHPEKFGQVDDMDDYQAKLDQARAKRDQLFAKIDSHVGDLFDIHESGITNSERDRGLRHVTFRGTPVSPGRGAGASLVAFYLSEREAA